MPRNNSNFPIEGSGFRTGMWRSVRQPGAILCLLGAGLVLALLGPFGTFNRMDMPLRLIYWELLCVANATGAIASLLLISHCKHSYQTRQEMVLLLLAASVANGVPGALIVATTNTVFGLGYEWRMATLIETSAFVVLITALLSGAAVCWELVTGDANSTVHDRFDERIPPMLHGELLALSSEDHYLRIYTSAGDALIHCQLKTAITELSAQRGEQVHRSHWVARGAVLDAQRVDGQWMLRLKNGTSIPVSRAHVRRLKTAGWLQRQG